MEITILVVDIDVLTYNSDEFRFVKASPWT